MKGKTEKTEARVGKQDDNYEYSDGVGRDQSHTVWRTRAKENQAARDRANSGR